MYFLKYYYALKCINYGRKIVRLRKPDKHWFHDSMKLSRLRGLCLTNYTIIIYGIISMVIERWHSKTFFHLLHSGMSSHWMMCHAGYIF